MNIEVKNDVLYVGDHFSVEFERTLRLPEDDQVYPLPPGLGSFPIHRVEDYADRVPAQWKARGGFFIPMYQREAMWLYFGGSPFFPQAVQVGVGTINAINGKLWSGTLSSPDQDQNYIVCPDQPWLDGFHAGEGYVRQFVAMPLGQGYSVEEQLSGGEVIGGLRLKLFAPKPGQFDLSESKNLRRLHSIKSTFILSESSAEMGLAAGGKMEQNIYPDEYGIDTWDEQKTAEVFIHIANSKMYTEITGKQPPETPISAQTYTEYGYPWFQLYDEGKGNIAPSPDFKGVKTVQDMDQQHNLADTGNTAVDIPDEQVKKI